MSKGDENKFEGALTECREICASKKLLAHIAFVKIIIYYSIQILIN